MALALCPACSRLDSWGRFVSPLVIADADSRLRSKPSLALPEGFRHEIEQFVVLGGVVSVHPGGRDGVAGWRLQLAAAFAFAAAAFSWVPRGRRFRDCFQRVAWHIEGLQRSPTADCNRLPHVDGHCTWLLSNVVE